MDLMTLDDYKSESVNMQTGRVLREKYNETCVAVLPQDDAVTVLFRTRGGGPENQHLRTVVLEPVFVTGVRMWKLVSEYESPLLGTGESASRRGLRFD